MRRHMVSFLFVFIVSCISSVAMAAPTWAPSPGFELKQVALFKNGLGFFVAEVACLPGRTDLRIVLPVTPSHGTFWLAYPSDVDLASAVAGETDYDEKIEATTIPELLAANTGRDVVLTIGDHELSGTILRCSVDASVSPAPLSYLRPVRSSRWVAPVENPPVRSRPAVGTVMLRTDAGVLCVNPDTVTNALFVGDNVNHQFTEQTRRTELQIRLRQPAPNRKITVTFLARGITWAPSYMVDISDEGTAQLSAKAVVINDACPLNDVDIQLVTGFPHLQFSGVASPVGKPGNLDVFLQALSRRTYEWGRPAVTSNVMVQSVAYAGVPEGAGTPEYGAAEIGAATEDLFFYPAGSIDLGQEEVAYLPLFTASVPYMHIYQWDIPDYVNEQNHYRYGSDRQNGQEEEEEIWHSLRLTNTTNLPWTTAPGETVKGGALLGQDTLRYTPSGAESTLRITRALGIKADQIELETDRQRNALQWGGSTYDLITVEGKLSVFNGLDKAVTLEITKTLSGEAITVAPEATQEKLAKGLRRVNPMTKLIWTVELAPGGEQKLSYTYEVYVH